MTIKQNIRILLATDAWHPQVNGVVRTLENVSGQLREMGHVVEILSHEGRKTRALPWYPEIKLAFLSQKEVSEIVSRFNPDCIHIATEGPIGLAVRRYCVKNKLRFTTGFHTRFAEYVEKRIPLPGVKSLCYALLRRFHKPSQAVLTPTRMVSRELQERGFSNVQTWTRGVDHETFRPYSNHRADELPRPVMVYVGRIAVEKGIEDFLRLDLPGTKLIIGDGPSRQEMQTRFSDAVFTGYLHGEALARKICSGDVFVFPSKTDTFGLVMLEAMACGLPVAAYPVTGPVDVIEEGYSGCMNDDLETAINGALQLSQKDAIEYAGRFTWKKTAQVMLEHLQYAGRQP